MLRLLATRTEVTRRRLQPYGVTGIFFVYRNDPYIDPRSLLAGLVARGES